MEFVLLLSLLILCFTKVRVLYVKPGDYCNEEYDCSSTHHNCSIMCPFENGNKRLYKTTQIKLEKGIYYLSTLKVKSPNNHLAEISVDDHDISFEPLKRSSEVLLKGFPEVEGDIGSIFYVSGKNNSFSLKNFKIEVRLDSNKQENGFCFYSYIFSFPQVKPSLQALEIEGMELKSLFGVIGLTETECRSLDIELLKISDTVFDEVYQVGTFCPVRYDSTAKLKHLSISLQNIKWVLNCTEYFYTCEAERNFIDIKCSEQCSKKIIDNLDIKITDRIELVSLEGQGCNLYYVICSGMFSLLTAEIRRANVTLGKEKYPTFSFLSASAPNTALEVIDSTFYDSVITYSLFEFVDPIISEIDVTSRSTNISVVNSTFRGITSVSTIFEVQRLFLMNYEMNVLFENCVFEGNAYGVLDGMSMINFIIQPIIETTEMNVLFSNCLFLRNVGNSGVNQPFSGMVGIQTYANLEARNITLGEVFPMDSVFVFDNCFFHKNKDPIANGLIVFTFTSVSSKVKDKDRFIMGTNFYNCTFLDNTAGSIIYFETVCYGSTAIFDFCGYGGLIEHTDGKLFVPHVIDCNFTSNQALKYGVLTSIRTLQENSFCVQFVLLRSIFRKNYANRGGAIYAKKTLIFAKNILLEKNQADSFGGGAFLQDSLFNIKLEYGCSSQTCFPLSTHYVPENPVKTTSPLIVVKRNHAKFAGGGIYNNLDPFCGYTKEEIVLQDNTACDGVHSNSGWWPTGITVSDEKNYCNDLGKGIVWNCELKNVLFTDVHGTKLSPKWCSGKIHVLEPFNIEVKFPKSIKDNDIKFSQQIQLQNEYKCPQVVAPEKEFKSEGFQINISFSTVQGTKFLSHVESRFILNVNKPSIIPPILYSLSSVLLLLTTMQCTLMVLCCFLLCCCCFSFCYYRFTTNKRKHREKIFQENFGKYPKGILKQFYDQYYTIKSSDESTGLLEQTERVEFEFHRYHYFRGSLDGDGTIFYFEMRGKKRVLYPFFRGKFKNGHRSGYGEELRIHHVRNENDLWDGRFWREYLKFSGFYVDGERDGKGTEYDVLGKKQFIGEWRAGRLSGIIWNNLKLDIIDIRTEVNLGRIIYPKAVTENIKASLYKGEYKGKECVVKLFEDTKDILQFQYLQRCNQIERNLQLLSLYSHPNVISYYGWSGYNVEYKQHSGPHPQSSVYFGYVMESFGVSVRDFFLSLRGNDSVGRIEMQIMKNRILYQVANGLLHLHKVCGLIHRDLKAANILCDTLGSVKICDFDDAVMNEIALSGRKNEPGLAGSPFHVAPEILCRETYDTKCDTYSYGILMFQILYFEKMDDPLDIISKSCCPSCGEELLDISDLEAFIKRHHAKCGDGFRPKMVVVEEEEEEEEGEGEGEGDFNRASLWQQTLMKRCWRANPEERPNMEEVVEAFSTNVRRETNLVNSHDFWNDSINSK